MYASLLSVWMLGVVVATPIDVKFAQVSPASTEAGGLTRSANQQRAVVLIQGLAIHPFSGSNVDKADWQGWQSSTSAVVTALGKNSDVFAVAYSQNCAVAGIADSPEFAASIARLKSAGYREIVLVGHSAGGLIARHFVEDHPDSGVTKVIQVCSPNGGSSWGNAECGVCDRQEVFLGSLTRQARETCLTERGCKKIPENVEFVCLVGHFELKVDVNYSFAVWKGHTVTINANKQFRGDGIVSSECQWTPDLQLQGIPAVVLSVNHVRAMRSQAAINKIAELVREKQPRLSPEEVATTRKTILGEEGQ